MRSIHFTSLPAAMITFTMTITGSRLSERSEESSRISTLLIRVPQSLDWDLYLVGQEPCAPDISADAGRLSHMLTPLFRGVAEGRGVFNAHKEHTPKSPLKRGLCRLSPISTLGIQSCSINNIIPESSFGTTSPHLPRCQEHRAHDLHICSH